MRDAPSIDIAAGLIKAGASVRAYDPISMEASKEEIDPAVQMMNDPYSLAEGTDALIVVTEWNEFKNLDLERIRDSMNEAVMLDGRNIYEPARIKALGFRYRGVGRGYKGSAEGQKGEVLSAHA
jgi:UDPglucose 6-dehydrogenase